MSGSIGKLLMIGGAALIVVGLIVWALGKFDIPLGQLPGDIHIKRDNSSFHFPIVTCIVASAVITLLLNLVFRFFR